MATGFTVAQSGNYTADLDDILIRREYFSDGNLWAWGYNTQGQLGDNTIVNKSSPIQTVAGGTNWKRIACGQKHTAAIKSDGTLWTWGLNSFGQLGDNTRTNRSSPVQTVAGGANWMSVAGGFAHTSAIKTDGTLWSWGRDNYGQLGDNSSADKSSPVQTVAGGTNWRQIACGYYHTAAIKADGMLWVWGYNTKGQLGDNTTIHKSSPIQTITGGSNWKSVACGGLHTAAIKTDGTLWVCGYNNYGQLGDNSTTNKSSPVQTITGGSNWKSVAGGQFHSAAIKIDGTLWMWGRNTYGELGDNTSVDKSSPIQTVAGGTNWKSAVNGQLHTNAIKSDGTLWSWGWDSYGQLGDGTVVNKSSPVQTIAGGTNWTSIACTTFHTMALTNLTF